MPLFRKATTEELEDHFFGSGAFQYGWFDTSEEQHFPVIVFEVDYEEKNPVLSQKTVTEEMFIEGIKKYAETLEDRSFDDLIEDMDANDVDIVIQLIMFGEIRYA
jgi:hypothetical protein